MKKLTLTLAIAATLFATSCKKDKAEEPEVKGSVEYIIRCNECRATLDVAAGKIDINVKGQQSVTDNNNLSDITVTTKGVGDAQVQIIIDGITQYYVTKNMDATGSAVHNLKIKR